MGSCSSSNNSSTSSSIQPGSNLQEKVQGKSPNKTLTSFESVAEVKSDDALNRIPSNNGFPAPNVRSSSNSNLTRGNSKLGRSGSFRENLTEKYNGVKVGIKFQCLDSFKSKYTGETMYKWRDAEVRIFDGSEKTTKACIHFIGWSDKFDQWIDLEKDWRRLAPRDVLSQSQIDSGEQLSPMQEEVVMSYLLHGEIPAGAILPGVLEHLGADSARHRDGGNKGATTAAGSEMNHKIPSSSNSWEFGYKVGQKVDVQDLLAKGAQKVSSKWRKAEVTEVAGAKIRVHYLGWDDTWDEIIDLTRESHRVREYETMTAMQDQAASATLRKSRSMGPTGKRMQRRSFDGLPSPTSQPSIPEGLNEGRLVSPRAFPFAQTDGDQKKQKKGGQVASVASMTDDEAQEAQVENDDIASLSPAELLSNRSVPLALKKKPVPRASFTGPGRGIAVAAMSGDTSSAVTHRPSNLDRRHSTGIVGNGLEEGSRRLSVEMAFSDRMENIGLHIIEIEPDGNCFFRAVAHQLYLDPERHMELRTRCVEHMSKHRDRFEIFCTTNFDQHLKRMSMGGTWAAELEIRAMEEILDRLFSIYSSDSREAKPTPMNTNFDEIMLLGPTVEIFKLSYHGNHYNSIFDQKYALPLSERKSRILLNARIKLFKGE